MTKTYRGYALRYDAGNDEWQAHFTDQTGTTRLHFVARTERAVRRKIDGWLGSKQQG